MNLLLIRHGEIPSNIKRTYAGRSNEGLTELGIEQAGETAAKLVSSNVDALYSSPIQRARQTSEIIGRAIHKDFQIDNAFRELEMGPWEGMSETFIAGQYPDEWHTWQTRPADLKLQGRETLDDLLKRVLSGVQGIYNSYPDKTVAVVTHVAIIRVLLLWDSGKSLNLYKTIHIPNAAVFRLAVTTVPVMFSCTTQSNKGTMS